MYLATIPNRNSPRAILLRESYREDGSGDDMARCGFFWLGGFMSDMTGSKAESLAGLARDSRRPSLRFDYSGHGESGGEFTDGTISAWLDQSLHMFRNHTAGRREKTPVLPRKATL